MATRFLVAGGSGNWNNNNNWSATSGGGSGASFPVSGDVVTFDTNSVNAPMTVNVTSAFGSLTMSNYTGTFTMNAQLNGSLSGGNVTLSVGMTVSGTGTISVTGTTYSMTSNGVVWSGSIQTANGTYTFDNWTITGNLNRAGPSNNVWNTGTLSVSGNYSVPAGGASGTTIVKMAGTGSLTTTGNGMILHQIVINTAGTVTISGTLVFANSTFTYTSGTVNTGTSTFSLTNGLVTVNTSTLNTNGINWYNVILGGTSSTHTLTSNLTITNLLTLGQTTAVTVAGAFNINAQAGVTLVTTATISNASGLLNMTGGTFTPAGFSLTGNTKFDGTITIAGNVTWKTGTLTFNSGPITSSTRTLTINGAGTVTTNFSGLTLNTISLSANVTFNGTNGWVIGTFSCVTAGVTITLGSTLAYEMTTNMTMTGTAASPILIKSSVGGSQATLTLDNTATASADVFCSATDIDSSLGQTIWSFGAVLTNTINWNVLTAPGTTSSSFVGTFV